VDGLGEVEAILVGVLAGGIGGATGYWVGGESARVVARDAFRDAVVEMFLDPVVGPHFPAGTTEEYLRTCPFEDLLTLFWTQVFRSIMAARDWAAFEILFRILITKMMVSMGMPRPPPEVALGVLVR